MVDPERLDDVIGVALACVPRRVKKQFAELYDPGEAAANRKITEAVTAAVLRYLEAVENPRPANTTPPYKYGNSG